MALVQNPRLRVALTFRDNNNKSADMSIYLPGSTTLADAVTFLGDLRSVTVPLTDAALVAGSILVTFDEDAPIDPPNSSEVERKLVVPTRTAVRGVNSRVELPSPIFTIEIDGTDIVDQNNVAVAAFKNFLVNGNLGAGNGPITIGGEPITRVEPAYIAHRSRKPR